MLLYIEIQCYYVCLYKFLSLSSIFLSLSQSSFNFSTHLTILLFHLKNGILTLLFHFGEEGYLRQWSGQLKDV